MNIDLNTFAEGAMREKFNQEFDKVLENIKDMNTLHNTKRKLIVELEFEPDEERELSMITIKTKTKLADRVGVPTKVIIDRDGNGNIIASELKNRLKGQTNMIVDEETGEIKVDDKKNNVFKLVGEE